MLKLNGWVIKPTIFPDGTSQVWKLPPNYRGPDLVEWVFESESEFMHLAQLGELVMDHSELWIPYLPYGRQDKRFSNDTTFALRPFAKLLSTLRFESVSTFDAHSEVIREYIRDIGLVSANSLIRKVSAGYDYLIFPDNGAAHRYDVPKGMGVKVGSKVRDESTGKIIRYELCGERIPVDALVLVVDDICDGGATFMVLAEALSHLETLPDLYVSHGIFSRGIADLLKVYGKIITTDSLPIKHREITVYESTSTHRLLQG